VDIDSLRAKTERSSKDETSRATLTDKLYRAGFYSAAERRAFLLTRIFAILFGGAVAPGVMYLYGAELWSVYLVLVLGTVCGILAPLAWLDRTLEERREDILYYLPLLIEQISIGVSSSLDIGPCLAQIVETADGRDSHNVITEFLVQVNKLMRCGMSLEEALMEVGLASGVPEMKHVFMYLAQCARHGGQISKQLTELADSVMMQRQIQIKSRIAALPVKATGPLFATFAGFFLLIFAGLFVRLALLFAV
jgi:pilus assembly protein TadC